MDHFWIAPRAPVIIKHLGIEIRNRRGSPPEEACLIEEVGIVADQTLWERLRLREEVPMPVGAGDLSVRVHEHGVGRHDVHYG